MSIEIQDLKKSFGSPPQEVLKGMSFSIPDGEFVAITGRSGCGKSTLLYLLSSLDFPTSGEVVIDGTRLTQLSTPDLHRFRNQKMGFVFQFHYLLPELSAVENVLMPARRTQSHLTRKPRAHALLEEFGLENKIHSLPSALSGGERQRVAIARALIMEPRYIFADEPTGNLDSGNGDIVLKILEDTSRNTGATVVFVTHDPDYAARAHRQIRMSDGLLNID
jgi:lipoprotein-releasing system ATP-binding protein